MKIPKLVFQEKGNFTSKINLPSIDKHARLRLTGFEELEYVFDLDNLQILPGMSGGLLIDSDQRPIGILSQSALFKDMSLVIPINEIKIFIHAPRDDTYLFQSNSYRINPNSLKIFGDNGHADSGDKFAYYDPNDELKFFREPQEGIPFPSKDSETIYLAFKGKRINSYTYNIKNVIKNISLINAFDNSLLITRDRNGYIDSLAIRKSILHRLRGFYSNLRPSLSKNKIRLFKRASKTSLGFKQKFKGTSNTRPR